MIEADQAGILLARSTPRSEAWSLRALRRALDLLIAVPALLVCAPLLAVLCLWIRLDSPGPAIFRQRRIGFIRRPFTVNKLRTMCHEADPTPHREYIAELVGGAETRHSDGERDLYKLTVDDRVTRIGKLLRRTSIDELPQLWNVLLGEMSLVGPRPVVPYELEHYRPSYFERFSVKPGLTGLWQVSGRNEKSYTEMVELDLEYVERRSLRLDLTIVLKTVWVVLTRKGVA
jgi:lipopolysaccharide/colanic/teichoic acid biosynthesis glycosyltransferase